MTKDVFLAGAARTAIERSGVSSLSYSPRMGKPGYGVATVRVLNSGRIHVMIGDPTSGQSHETVVAQVLADEFGVSPEDVRLDCGDTLSTPFGMGNVGNRMASYTTSAAVLAARELKKKLSIVAAHDLLVAGDPEEFCFEDGKVVWTRDRSKAMSIAQIARHLIEVPINLPAGITPGLEHTAYYEPTGAPNMVGSSFHAAIVEVNPESGELKILRYVVVDDCGQAINPLVVEGQVQGGVRQRVAVSLVGCTQPKATTSSKAAGTKVEGTRPTGPSNATEKPAELPPSKPAEKPVEKPADKPGTPPPAVPEKK